MFTAITKNGRRVILEPFLTGSLSLPPPYYCPVCREEVILKKGTRRRWHFAHRSFSNCALEPESEDHLNGKAALYHWLTSQGLTPFLEVFLPSIQRQADILFTFQNRTYAIEYQCAAISVEDVVQRSQDYLSQQIDPLWIYSSSRLRPAGSSTYSIHSFEWSGLREAAFAQRPALVYFAPRDRRFYFLFPNAALSPIAAFADLYTLPLSSLKVSQLTELPLTKEGKQIWRRQWLRHKKKWRYQRNHWQTRQDSRYARQIFAAHCSDIPYFPWEAGWPVGGMYYLNTEPHLWQSLFLLKLQSSFPLYRQFSTQAAGDVFSPVVTEHLSTKTFPLIKAPLQKAIRSYLYLLEKMGIVYRTGTGWKRVTDIRMPASLDEGYSMDKKWHQRIFY
ncbi:competence protein CoiA [Salibacterium aidingense]|uniref:competence protein CoiA n=1 Tax=Salibacterium aidingense TaxID=384933 RepID=UPI003BEDAF42